MVTIALSHLLERGVRLETHEAVALARSIMAHPCGIPTPENIQLGSDGSASCISSKGIPSVANVADLLLILLPPGARNVPAPLHYAIARGLGAVEAPPFGSLTEFSNALARFEKGESSDVLRGILQRSARPSRPSAPEAAALVAVPTRSAASTPAPRSTVVAFPTRVVPEPAVGSSESPESIPDAPAMIAPVDEERKTHSPVHAWGRWRLAVAVALVVSFTAGFAVTHGLIDRRFVNTPGRSAHGSSDTPHASRPANNPAPRSIEGEPGKDSMPPPEPVAAGSRPPGTGAHGAIDTESRPVEHAREPVGTIEAVRGTDGADAYSPASTSEGTAMFLQPGDAGNGHSANGVVKADTQTEGDLGIMTIADGASHNYHARPSPDGFSVAFDSDRDGQRGIYVANRDGSHVRRVSGDGYAALPTWSPNNDWLAYIRAEADDPSVWNLWVQSTAGGTARRVTNYQRGQTSAASWFPDSRRIAYSHDATLMVMNVQTAELTRYQTPVPGQPVRTPAVSPDGTKIIFQAGRDGAWLLAFGDGSMRRVLTDSTAEEFAWAPDGRRVAYHSRHDRHWGLYVLSPA